MMKTTKGVLRFKKHFSMNEDMKSQLFSWNKYVDRKCISTTAVHFGYEINKT